MTKSEEWDKRDKLRRKLPFSAKVLIGVGILVILITLLIAFTTQPIYAYTGDCDRLSVSEQDYYSVMLCYAKSIFDQNEIILKNQFELFDQNEQIIKKIDWNNCAISHIDTAKYGGYQYDISDIFHEFTDNNARSYKQLVYNCGERP